MDLTLNDLAKVTWDSNKEEVVGVYLGEEVTKHRFLLPLHPFTLAVVRFNLSEGWAEYYLYENMQNRKISHEKKGVVWGFDPKQEPLVDDDGEYRVKRHKYDGPLHIFSQSGNTLAILGG